MDREINLITFSNKPALTSLMAIIFFRLGNEIAIPLLVFGERPVEKFLNTAHKLIQEPHTTIFNLKKRFLMKIVIIKFPNFNFTKWSFT
jgi:hypothetical protein